MTAFIRAESELVATMDVGPITVPVPSHQAGDVIIAQVITSFDTSGAGLPIVTNEIASVTPDYASIGAALSTLRRIRVLARVAESGTEDGITLRRTSGPDVGVGTIFAAKVWVIGGVDTTVSYIDSVSISALLSAANGSAPAVTVTASDDLVLMLYGNTEAHSSGVGLTIYEGHTEVLSLVGSGAAMRAFTLAAGSNVPAAASSVPVATTGRYAFIGIAFKSRATVRLPATAPASLMALGCADDYQVYITAFDQVTQTDRDIDSVGWSEVTWERSLDEFSSASATIPDRYSGVFCVAKHGGLLPWRYGLRIERNEETVWKGPVTGLSRPVDDFRALPVIRVTASDMLVRFSKRLATRSATLPFKNVDAGFVLYTILGQSAIVAAPYNGFRLEIPSVVIGTSITREVVAREFEYAWDVVRELLESAVDGYILNGELVIFQQGVGWMVSRDGITQVIDGPYDTASGELIYGLFTEESYADRPGWQINGLAQGNNSFVPGADAGSDGFRRYWSSEDVQGVARDGILDIVDPSPLYRSSPDGPIISDETFQRRADSLVALRSQAPAVIQGGSLSPNAPVSVDHLRPGSIWKIDIWDAGFGQLLQNGRLKRVSGRVSRDNDGKLVEQISPTVQPVGYTEADF